MNSLDVKHSRSHPFFRNTRVDSCRYILANNTYAIAIAFPYKKTGYKAPYSWVNTVRSAETQSHYARVHKEWPRMHAGMGKKPLIPYSPTSLRSRLLSPRISVPNQFRSSIQIGDRFSLKPKFLYKTTYKSFMQYPRSFDLTSNPAIIAQKTQWHKSRVNS